MNDKHSENSTFRVLDAAINRASEGIRVVEDYARMVLGDAYLSNGMKQLRHDLTQAVSQIDHRARIAARDSLGDVGRFIETKTEYQRGESTQAPNSVANPPLVSGGMVQANLARCQQALRTIEEFSKTVDPDIARRVEQLRYQSYTLEKALLTTLSSLENLAEAKLYVLIDSHNGGQDSKLIELVDQLVAEKTDLIQLRDKRLTDRQVVEVGRAIVGRTRGTRTRLIMNDRADLALACGADGVHLGQDDLPIAEARRLMGASKIIGVSTHSIAQARQAVLEGANYIGVGPVFASTTKQFDQHVGLELVSAVAQEIQLPAFAIGGIDLKNVATVIAAGMTRVAVGAAIAKSATPGLSAAEFKRALA